MLAEEGYPNGFELKFANTALPGTQFMVDIGTAIADMWTKIGVKVTLKHYEWGSFAPMERGDQAGLVGWASMYRTAGRPDAPWRYNGPSRPRASSTCSATRTTAMRRVPGLRQDLPRPAGRTRSGQAHGADRPHGRAHGQYLDGGADPRGHGLLRDQHARRSGSSRRSPAGTSWAMCSSASRGRRRSPGRSEPGGDGASAMKRYIARRLMQGVVLLCMVATIVFFLGRLTGNPVDLMLPEDATPEDRAALTQTLGLDGPIARAVRDLRRQGAAWRSRHLDPHAAAGGRGVLRPPAQHARAHPLGDPARHGARHPAWRGGRAQSRRPPGSRGRHGRRAGRRHAELLAGYRC